MKTSFIIFALFGSISCFSQAGTLDKSFGNNGKVYTDIDGKCYALALQPDGKILAGGYAYYGFTLIRYLPDGSLDNSFGDTGIVYISGSIFIGSSLHALAVLPDRSILAAGAGDGLLVVKYKENGIVDSSFGANGVSNPSEGGAFDIQVQADGKIVLAGSLLTSETEHHMLLIRLNVDGSLDKNFGTNGRVIDYSGYRYNCLALQEDGKIVAGGHNWPVGAGNRDEFSITRYNTDGSRDVSFGQGGRVLTDVSEGNDVPYDLKILNDGSIVATGITDQHIGASKTHTAVVKYDSDGKLNKEFGDKGIVRVLFDDRSSYANSILVQQDGKLIVTGYVLVSEAEGNGDFAMARLNSNGSLDSSFGINGEVMSDFGESEVSYASVLQTDEKIILAGFSYIQQGPRYPYLLARYNNDEAMPLHFTYFNASPTNNGGIALNWQTAQENNNSYFAVERTASNDFAEITKINSKGNSSQLQTYSYIDNAPLQGTNFYRLKQVDKDGKFSYSQVVSATIQNGISVILYPNPVKDVLNIKGLDAGMSYELSVMSVKGNVVAQTSINNKSSYLWNLQSLSKGVYYLSVVSTNNKKATVKFVKE